MLPRRPLNDHFYTSETNSPREPDKRDARRPQAKYRKATPANFFSQRQAPEERKEAIRQQQVQPDGTVKKKACSPVAAASSPGPGDSSAADHEWQWSISGAGTNSCFFKSCPRSRCQPADAEESQAQPCGPVPLSTFQKVFQREMFYSSCAWRLQTLQPETNVLLPAVFRGALARKTLRPWACNRTQNPCQANSNSDCSRIKAEK